MGGRASRFRVRVLAPLALFVLSVAVRALPAREVLVEGRTFFLGYDAYYHMRRIVYSIVHFPAALGFDPYLNHPDGARAIWTPFFDWVFALALRPVFDPADPNALERAAVWVPPVLGAATVVVVYFLALRFFGVAVALIAGGVLSVMSGHFWYSQIGFVDHHAAVALAAALMLGAGMALLAPQAARRSPWLPAIATGIAFGGALLLWPGMLLHVGLVQVGLLVHLLTLPRGDEAIAFARRLALVHGFAFALLLPFGANSSWEAWSRFSPVVLSEFQPWYFGVAAGFCLACVGGWRVERLARTRGRRVASALTIGGVLLVASAAVFPDLSGSLGDAWEWMAKRDSFQDHVAESKPLFYTRDGFTLNVALVRLSMFSLLVPFALACGLVLTRGRADRASIRLLLWWSFGLCVVTILQKRFFNSASIAVSLLFALSFHGLYTRLPAKLLARATSRWAARAVLAAVALFLLLPMIGSYRDHIVNIRAGWGGEDGTPSIETRRKFAMIQMANWIRMRTPAPSAWLDARARPTYGILAPWTLGHVLEYEARRPTVTTNFGDDIGRKNYLLARRYYQSEEGPAAELLDRLRVRYVIAQAVPNYLGEEPLPGSMFFALFEQDGAGVAGAGPERLAEPALERHRLIYESPPLARTEPPSPSLYKLFEYVRGARVVGRASPGARVRASLPLQSNRRRKITYTAEVVASPSGEYVFRFPYANSGGPRGVRVGASYRIECRGEAGNVVLDEAAVSAGETVAGPELCGGTSRNDGASGAAGLL